MMGNLPLERRLDGRTSVGQRFRPSVTFYLHDEAEPLDASAFVSRVWVTKDLAQPEGQWQVEVRPHVLVGGRMEHVDWRRRVKPGDWALIDFHDGRAEWPQMVGPVNRVHRSQQGQAAAVAYVLSGYDHGRCFTRSDIILLPQFKHASALDLTNDLGPFLSTINKLVTRYGRDGTSPHELVPALTYFFLGAYLANDFERGATPVWHMPRSLRMVPLGLDPDISGAVDDVLRLLGKNGWPIADALGFLIEPTLGRAVLRETFEGLPDGQRLWDFLASWANLDINELYLDFLPRRLLDGEAPTPEMYQGGPADKPHTFAPALALRRRPFPTDAVAEARRLGYDVPNDGPSGVQRWQRLPWTEIDERQLASDETSRHDDERANFYLALAHASYGASPYTLALGAAGRGNLPITLPGDAERHGWQRRQMQSPFLPTDPKAPMATYYVWSRMLKDWYERNPEYWSGALTAVPMLPGVRVGERLHVLRNGGNLRETYYLEGVKQEWMSGQDGKVTTKTTMTVTRGHEHPLGGFTARDDNAALEAFERRGRTA